MASSSKKKTTMAKLTRENKLRERRMEKQARKDARRETSTTLEAQLAETTEEHLAEIAAGGPFVSDETDEPTS